MEYQTMNTWQVEERAQMIGAAFATAFETFVENLEELSAMDAISVFGAMRIVNEYVKQGLQTEAYESISRSFDAVFSVQLVDGVIRLVPYSADEIARRASEMTDLIVHPRDTSKVN